MTEIVPTTKAINVAVTTLKAPKVTETEATTTSAAVVATKAFRPAARTTSSSEGAVTPEAEVAAATDQEASLKSQAWLSLKPVQVKLAP